MYVSEDGVRQQRGACYLPFLQVLILLNGNLFSKDPGQVSSHKMLQFPILVRQRTLVQDI